MGVGQWCFEVVADLFVELGVLLVSDVFFGPRPDGIGLVDGFPLVGGDHLAAFGGARFVAFDLFALFPFLFLHQDRQADVVGVFADDALDLPGAGVVFGVFAQVQGDAGTAQRAVDGFHLEIAGTAADPAHALVGWEPGTTAFHRNFVGHDKAGVETDTELTDQLRVGLLVAAEFADEIFGATLGNRAQVVDGFRLAHADTVVGDGECAGLFVQAHAHFQRGRVFKKRRRIERFVAQFVAGIRRVGDQLAQENLFIGVQRMGNQVQQLGDFGLEGKGLFAHGSGLVSEKNGWRSHQQRYGQLAIMGEPFEVQGPGNDPAVGGASQSTICRATSGLPSSCIWFMR